MEAEGRHRLPPSGQNACLIYLPHFSEYAIRQATKKRFLPYCGTRQATKKQF